MRTRTNESEVLDKAKQELRYDAETGHLFWVNSKKGRRKKNPHAGCKTKSGYITICHKGKPIRAHRLAWFIVNGSIDSTKLIDHVNGNPSDNRINNLRMASHAQNCRNSKLKKTNTSGIKGVSWLPSRKKWKAQLFLNRKNHNIGYFTCKFVAEESIKLARKKLHKEFAKH